MSTGTGETPAPKRLRPSERTMLACTNCKQQCLVEDPATGLHRPRNYIRSLENQATQLESRVAYLETLLRESRPEVALDHFGGNLSGSAGRAFLQVPPGENSGVIPSSINFLPGEDQSPDADAPGADVLRDEVALLCLGAAGREPQYFGPSSALSFSRIASSVMGLPRRGRATSSQPSTVGESSVGPRRRSATNARSRLIKEFPSSGKMAQLSQAYFKNIHPQYPFLHRPTVQAMEQVCLEACIDGSLSDIDDNILFFVLMIYAIGSLALGKYEVDDAETYYSLALECIGSILELDNLQSIQAILCCAVYSVRSPTGVSLWKLSGLAIRHCVELGYHRSTQRYRNLGDSLTKEISKRCFWVAYDIDRVASFILGRPVGIPDSAVDVELPYDINDEDIATDGLKCDPRTNPADPPTTMTAALHAIKLRQLWSKFSDSIYSSLNNANASGISESPLSVESLRQELEQWKAATPDIASGTSPNGEALSVFASPKWFQLAYDYSILLLYRHYIIGSDDSSREMMSPLDSVNMDARDRAFEVCAEHARDICLVYRHLYQTQGAHVQFTWGSLHILFLGGLAYLYCLWRSPSVRQKNRPTTVMNTCMACTTVLIIIADRWPSAISYRDIFETLSERTINMMCGNQENLAHDVRLRTSDEQSKSSANPNLNVDGGNAFDPPADAFDSSTRAAFDTVGDDTGGIGFMDSNIPFQDWIIGLGNMEAAGDSQWLAQELFDGMKF